MTGPGLLKNMLRRHGTTGSSSESVGGIQNQLSQYISIFKNIDRYKSHEEISRLKSYHEELFASQLAFGNNKK